jgi:capsular polysaccharide biosynthesis protein
MRDWSRIMEQRTNVVEVDVKELFYLLLHKLWLIVLVGILGAACAGAASTYLMQPIYTSTTKVYVVSRQDESKMTLSDLQTGTQLTQDYMVLVRSRPVMEQVIEELNLDITEDELFNMINVVTPEGTRILEISVTYYDPVMTKKMADAIAEESSVQMINIMEMKKVNIVESGNLPTAPSSPNIFTNTILGGIMGLAITSVIIIMVHVMNDSIKSSDDIEKYLGITTLGLIPLEDGLNKKRNKLKHTKKKEILAS